MIIFFRIILACGVLHNIGWDRNPNEFLDEEFEEEEIPVINHHNDQSKEAGNRFRFREFNLCWPSIRHENLLFKEKYASLQTKQKKTTD